MWLECGSVAITSKRTAQTWRDEHRITISQVGAKIYYRLTDVEQLLQSNLNHANKTTPHH
ncbi:MAG: helix-turn-helix domain-containing protein [Bacteroidales bacterium]|nr:helix-turn-helix domain-containing protein [Bacteroidales bacterium]